MFIDYVLTFVGFAGFILVCCDGGSFQVFLLTKLIGLSIIWLVTVIALHIYRA